jgi:mannose-6-phosphate isomerase-like protein (cupin superfamily)
MHVDTDVCDLAPGDAVVIPGGAWQWIENTGAKRLRFVAVVSPPWRREDDERA